MAYWYGKVREQCSVSLTHELSTGFLVREVLEAHSSFSRATAALAASSLIAPVYFTVCGIRPNEGVLLTRERETDLHRWSLNGFELLPVSWAHLISCSPHYRSWFDYTDKYRSLE